ncbi:MAG: hypothetical protein JWM53_6954 [bacterium]|nr:hypothetical protein [bacterium]
MKKLLLPFVVSAALCGGVALAQSEGDGRPPRQIPEEAFAACTNLSEGDACTANVHDQEVKGQCIKGRQTRLWCRPSGPRPHRPPQ